MSGNEPSAINSEDFIGRRNDIRFIRQLMLKDGVELPHQPQFAIIDRLIFSKKGVSPSLEQHQILIQSEEEISKQIPPKIREIIKYEAAHGVVQSWMLRCTAIFVLALLIGISADKYSAIYPSFGGIAFMIGVFVYIPWCLSFGGLGSTLSLTLDKNPQDSYYLSDTRRTRLRLLAGMTLAMVVSAPLTPDAFRKLLDVLAGKAAQPMGDFLQSGQMISLLLPFVFGFSTTLALKILRHYTTEVKI